MQSKGILTGIPNLDIILSGGNGIKLGKLYEIFGEESTSKSTLAQYLLIRYKEQFNRGIALYIDTENSFDLLRYAYMGGKSNISLSHSIVVEETLQDIINVLNKSIISNEPALIVWDTVAASMLKGTSENDYSKGIASKARLLNSALPYIINLLKKSNSVLILINQVYSVIGKFGGIKTKGGRGIRYYSSVRLQVRRVKDYEKIINGIPIIEGIGVEVKTIKNKLFYPRLKTFIFIHNEKGIQPLDSIIEYMKENKIVSSSGAWKRLVIDDRVDIKFNTAASFNKRIEEQPDILTNISYLIFQQYASVSPLAKIKLLPEMNKIEKRLKLPATILSEEEKSCISIEKSLLKEENETK